MILFGCYYSKSKLYTCDKVCHYEIHAWSVESCKRYLPHKSSPRLGASNWWPWQTTHLLYQDRSLLRFLVN